nr:hypothetical protein [Tanacetum cinerariifolium]
LGTLKTIFESNTNRTGSLIRVTAVRRHLDRFLNWNFGIVYGGSLLILWCVCSITLTVK